MYAANVRVNQRRLTLVSAIYSDLPSLLQPKGNIIDGVSEFCLVSSDEMQKLQKTKQTVVFLQPIKLWALGCFFNL
uniref:Uncharacterized protein n=1 Tax=Glossina austeni TaxID=7395 RepID=A0A1A9VDU3_GLOAU